VFQNPRQDEVTLQKYYRTMFREEKLRPQENIQQEFKNRSLFINKFKDITHTNLLEVGCADGTTLSNLRDNGFEVYGIEVSEENSDICSRKNLNVFNGMYSEFDTESQKFDLVCSFYVMEHLLSPVEFLLFCNKILSKNGIICIEIPDIKAYKIEKATSDLLFFFEHQSHFTKKTLISLLSRTGFTLIGFDEKPTHDFGMYFAAKKTSKPIDPKDVKISHDAVVEVMDLIDEYKKHYENQELSFNKKILNLLENHKSVALCGANSNASRLLGIPQIKKNSIKYILDNNEQKIGKQIYGIPIIPVSKIDDSVNLIIILSSFSKELTKQLKNLGVSDDKIVIVE